MEIESVTIKVEGLDEECNIIEDESNNGRDQGAETSNEKPYKCGICGHRTTSDTLLKVHMKMHLVKRIHQCNICKSTFNFVSELNSHILTHTKDKSNFQCDICNRDFFTEEDLQRHCRVHTKEKPFKCKLCFRAFSDYSYLRVHERSHHGEDYLRNTMKKDGTYVDPSIIQNLNEDGTTPKVSVSVQETTGPKKSSSSSPSNEEKVLQLHRYEEVKLNNACPPLEQITNYLKHNWAKIFAEHNSDRNSENSARPCCHMKNQTNTHIERSAGLSECSNVNMEPCSCLQRRSSPDLTNGIPCKKLKTSNDDTSSEFDKLKLKFLLAEEKRRDHLYKIELREKEELFKMEKKHREEIYKKELDIKNLELMLLREKNFP